MNPRWLVIPAGLAVGWWLLVTLGGLSTESALATALIAMLAGAVTRLSLKGIAKHPGPTQVPDEGPEADYYEYPLR
jgi:hypothetical protein